MAVWARLGRRRGGRPPWGRRAPAAAVAAAAAAAFAAGPVWAQPEDTRRLERALRQAEPELRGVPGRELSLGERAFVDAGGFFTFTFLNLNDESSNSRRLLQYDTTLYARISVDDTHSFFGRSRFRYRDFSPGDSFDNRGDRWAEPYLDRYWYEYSSALGSGIGGAPASLRLRVGRQFVDWGAGLALSETLLAARPTLTWGVGNRFTLEGIAGVTPGDESIIDFDTSRDQFDSDTRRGFFGGQLRLTTPRNQQFYVFGLYMADFNDEPEPARFGGIEPVDFGYTSTYWGVGTEGSIGANILYLGEFVYQTGHSMSDPLRTEQTREDISAFAARAQLTYQFRDQNLTRLQIEGLLASGDDDRLLPSETVGGNLAGTTDHAFNSMGFANTGLAFAPSLSNLMSLRVGASTFPFRSISGMERLQVGADVLVFGKLDRNAPIDEPTLAKTYLGVETDLFVNYRVTSDLALNLRYGAFFPGSAIDGSHETRQFILFAATLSF